MSYDEQPDGDPHGECAAEIRRLERDLAARDERVRELEAGLRKLVRLKDLHDRIEDYDRAPHVGLGTEIDEYRRCKPLAWDRARALLAPPATKEPTCPK